MNKIHKMTAELFVYFVFYKTILVDDVINLVDDIVN